MTLRTGSLLFGLVVALCLAQIGWWIYFQIRETGHAERAAALLQQGDTAAAARALGADETGSLSRQAQRRRIMFVSEGAALGLLVLVGVVVFHARTVRERRLLAAQERFLAGATHELKSPLAALRLGLESMLASTVPAAKREAYLHGMVEQVERLERDVTNLLAAAGLHTGDRRLALRTGDLAADVLRTAAEIGPRLEAAGIDLSTADVHPVHLPFDRDAMHVVLRNLLDNALKYCRRGDRVRLSLRETNGTAELRVADDGPGIGAEDQRRIFERFYRGSSAPHRGGAGLGLHLVQQLVAAHGGRVEVHSEGPEKGTEFVVVLPRAGSAP